MPLNLLLKQRQFSAGNCPNHFVANFVIAMDETVGGTNDSFRIQDWKILPCLQNPVHSSANYPRVPLKSFFCFQISLVELKFQVFSNNKVYFLYTLLNIQQPNLYLNIHKSSPWTDQVIAEKYGAGWYVLQSNQPISSINLRGVI